MKGDLNREELDKAFVEHLKSLKECKDHTLAPAEEQALMTRPTDGDHDIEELWWVVGATALAALLGAAIVTGGLTWMIHQLPWWLR